jgi:hypothetical protein
MPSDDWSFLQTPLTPRGTRVSLGSVSFEEWLVALQTETDFRQRFNSLLAEQPYRAFRWELPQLTTSRLMQPFECVILDDQSLDRPADRESFAEHFSTAAEDESVLAFPNLGGDAILIVPMPVAEDTAYPHLAAFTRLAPETQIDAFWERVATLVLDRLQETSLWLSTAGAGVAWLHLRIDQRPKYFAYQPYRTER